MIKHCQDKAYANLPVAFADDAQKPPLQASRGEAGDGAHPTIADGEAPFV